MSREAVNYVLKNSQTESGARLVMFSLAHHCPKVTIPFIVRTPARIIAKDANLTQRYVQEILAELDQSGELTLLRPGSGRRPNTYELSCVVACPRS